MARLPGWWRCCRSPLLTIVIYALLRHANVLLAMAWSVGVLYIAMGFRRFSHCFTDIAQALREQDINSARDVLGHWRGIPADELHAAEVARVSIELGLLQAHRYVLGPIFWFVMLGPVGPVVYRAADLLVERWGKQVEPEKRIFALFAERAFSGSTGCRRASPRRVSPLPAISRMPPIAGAPRPRRGAAMPRAWCWPVARVRWASSWAACCARRACSTSVRNWASVRTSEVEDLRGAVGLIWRALVLWLFLLFIVSIARALG